MARAQHIKVCAQETSAACEPRKLSTTLLSTDSRLQAARVLRRLSSANLAWELLWPQAVFCHHWGWLPAEKDVLAGVRGPDRRHLRLTD